MMGRTTENLKSLSLGSSISLEAQIWGLGRARHTSGGLEEAQTCFETSSFKQRQPRHSGMIKIVW